MNFSQNLISFSTGGEYLAVCSPDGCLQIWETSTNILRQEYTPTSHLSATCSALSWRPNNIKPENAKKAKKEGKLASVNLEFIAMGTKTGDVLLYSFTEAELYSTLSSENQCHSAKVNGVCWLSDYLFSCSDDKYIIIWNVLNNTVKTKWKANQAIYSMCVIDHNNLLSASTTIEWWDIKKQCVIKTFSGHATEIIHMQQIYYGKGSSERYFVSMATGDRIINAWQMSENRSSTKKSLVASFVSTAEPANIALCKGEEDEPMRMSVVTIDGTCHIYEHQFNGKLKPVQPKFTIQVASKRADETKKPKSVPVLAVNLSEEGLDSCLLVYNDYLRPSFERINIADQSTDVFLIRSILFSSAPSTRENVLKTKKTEKPRNVKLLAPGLMTQSSITVAKTRKRKLNEVNISELPMEERLKALDLSVAPKEETKSIQGDSMAHVLLQGLQSNDNTLLDSVFQRGDEAMIRNTIQRLPLPSILPVLRILNRRLKFQEPRHHPCLKWLTALISAHLPYLMSCRDIEDYLGPINQTIEARLDNFSKMSQLGGCLKILLSQPTLNKDDWKVKSEPTFEYISGSSDEEEEEKIKVDEELNEHSVEQVSQWIKAETSSSESSESEMET